MIDKPRSTPRQNTRWDTQDLAWESASTAKPTTALKLLLSLAESPSTCDELEQRHGLTHQTCSAAVNWLMRRNLIVTDGKRVTRSGRAARVWRPALPHERNGPSRRDLKAEVAALTSRCELLTHQLQEAMNELAALKRSRQAAREDADLNNLLWRTTDGE